MGQESRLPAISPLLHPANVPGTESMKDAKLEAVAKAVAAP